MQDRKLEKLNKLMELMQNDTVTPKEIEAFLILCLDVIKKSKDKFESLSIESLDKVNNAIKYIDSEHSKIVTKIFKETSESKKDFEKRVSDVNKMIAEIKAIKVRDGFDGKDGLDGKDGIDGKDGSPDTPEEIAKKLNLLTEVVDISVIKGLTKRITDLTNNVANGAISAMPITTSFVNGVRAKNINFNGSNFSVSYNGDTANINFSSSASAVTLAEVSAASLLTADSLYQLTSGIPVEFRSSDGNPILYLDETNERVGVGRIPTTHKLEVSGNSKFIDSGSGRYIEFNPTSGNQQIIASAGGFNISAASGSTRYTVSGTDSFIQIDNASQVAGVLIRAANTSYFNGGNVGIGTTSPQGSFHMKARASDYSGGLILEDDGDGKATFITQEATKLFIGKGTAATPTSGSSTVAVIQDNGYIGIGTSSPTARLNVNNYGTGTGTVATNGTTTLTGTGTKFLSTFSPGDTFTVSGETSRVVSTVASDTSLTVTVAFSTTASGLSYSWTAVDRLTVSDARYAIFGQVHSTLPGLINAVDTTLCLTGTQGGSSSQYLAIKFNSAGNNTGSIGTYFSNAANVFNIVSGGVTCITSLGSGNVGVGTTAPSKKLEVAAADGTGILSLRRVDTTIFGGNVLGELQFTGDGDGTAKVGAKIVGAVASAENWGANDYPAELQFYTTPDGSATATQKAVLTSGGNFGIGVTIPTAVLHIKAGTTSASTAPLKFTTGSLNTTAEAGAMEFLAEKFYLTPTSTARASVPGVLFTQTNTVTVANTVTETTLIGTGEGSVTLPANFFVAGKTIRLRGYGFHSSTGSPTIRLRIKLGSTTILDTTAINSHNATNAQVDWEGVITCRTTGGTGTVIGQGFYQEFQSPDVSNGMVNTTTTTIDTTASLAVNATIEWGTADAGNTISVTNLILEVLN